MSEHVGKTVVEKGDEEALQAYLDEVEQAVRDTSPTPGWPGFVGELPVYPLEAVGVKSPLPFSVVWLSVAHGAIPARRERRDSLAVLGSADLLGDPRRSGRLGSVGYRDLGIDDSSPSATASRTW